MAPAKLEERNHIAAKHIAREDAVYNQPINICVQ